MLDTIKSIVPPLVRQKIKMQSRMITGPLRIMPDFLIIGAQKCGTTSLYHYLVEHPYVMSASRKQMHFFDNNFNKGITWYRTHFPSYFYKYYFRQTHKKDFITGEATPYYIFHPLAARRVAQYMPHAKFVLIIRNPVDRTYSHYNHEMRKGTEKLSFTEALEIEPERLKGEKEKMLADESYYSFSLQHHSYIARSLYADQMEEWLKYFPLKQFLILRSEDFYKDPTAVLREILEFLKVPESSDFKVNEYKNYNPGGYDKLDPAMREKLQNFFRPHNDRLYKLIDKNLGW